MLSAEESPLTTAPFQNENGFEMHTRARLPDNYRQTPSRANCGSHHKHIKIKRQYSFWPRGLSVVIFVEVRTQQSRRLAQDTVWHFERSDSIRGQCQSHTYLYLSQRPWGHLNFQRED